MVEVGAGYVVSELVEGPSLLSVVASAGARGGEELDRIAARTLTALGAIHQAGLAHGSFHPGSVLLGPEGAVVTDFGVARGGVPAYASPEQVAADRFTPAGDLFAWAATMAYAATGRPPYGDGEPAAIFQRILRAEPELGQLSGALRNVVAACLAKDPATRPTAQVAQQLLVSGVPSAPSSGAFKQPPAKPPAPRKQRDLRVPIAAGVAAVLVVGAAVAWAVLRPKEAPKAAVLAGNEQPTTPSAAPTPSVMKTKKRHTPKPLPTRTQNVVLPPQQQVTVTVSKTPPAKKSTGKPAIKPAVTPTPTRTPTPSDPPKTGQPQPQPQVQTQRPVNMASGRCLVVRDNEKRAGKFVIQWPCKTTGEQRWRAG